MHGIGVQLVAIERHIAFLFYLDELDVVHLSRLFNGNREHSRRFCFLAELPQSVHLSPMLDF